MANPTSPAALAEFCSTRPSIDARMRALALSADGTGEMTGGVWHRTETQVATFEDLGLVTVLRTYTKPCFHSPRGETVAVISLTDLGRKVAADLLARHAAMFAA